MLKNEKIHTAIETNGTSERLTEIAAYVDYLIMDFKHFDTRKLQMITGVGNEMIKQNFESFCESARQLCIRIPLVNGFNTETPTGFADYFSKYDTKNVSFEFLTYHEYGKEKWKTPYTVKNGFVSDAQLKTFKRVFTDNKLRIINT